MDENVDAVEGDVGGVQAHALEASAELLYLVG